jgi:mannose-6-phosphate isomerase-like protein (cupin superfamily)
MDREAIFLERDHATEPGESGRSIRRLANPEDSQDRCVCRLETMAAGASLSGRTVAEETLYVLRGSVQFQAAEQTRTIGPGDFVRVSSRVPWSIENRGKEEAEVFVLSAFAVDKETAEAALNEREPFSFRGSGEGKLIGIVGDVYRMLATAEETNGRCSIWEATVFTGGGPPTHIHENEDEGFFVLEGEMQFQAPSGTVMGGPGFFAYLPIGVPHSFRNVGQPVARMLIFTAPGGVEKLFERAGQVFQTAPTEAQPPDEQEIQRLHDLAEEYGIEFIAAR